MRTLASSLSGSRRAITWLLLAVVLLSGCGGSDGGSDNEEKNVEALLDRAFKASISSADLKIDAQLDVDGLAGLKGPVRLEAEGSYVAGEGTLPKLDLDVKGGAPDAGQAIEVGLLSTGDRAFVEFGGEFYEQPQADVDRANRDLRREQGGSPSALGLDPRKWVIQARDEGEEEIAKVPADHVSARLDVKAVLDDLNGLVQRTGGAGAKAKPLSGEQLTRAEEIVGDPRFDVYVGKDDSIIRRMSANLEFVVPEAQQARFRGAKRGSLRISVELSDVNGDQRVRAPAEARPISDLASQLGGLGALRGEGGLGSPEEGENDQSDPGGGSALQRYDECLDQAAPDDTAALSRCSDLLR
ncbi:MAG: hypothetical protein H0U32_02190 [Thermoleophilaceae bacterium]|nr:hypothetical protein [Thermoleophilaceae bacterium]